MEHPLKVSVFSEREPFESLAGTVPVISQLNLLCHFNMQSVLGIDNLAPVCDLLGNNGV